MSRNETTGETERRSLVNASELVVTLIDYDDRTAPRDGARALRLRISSDVAFVYLGKITEGVGSERFDYDDETASVGVDAQALYEALGSMLRRSDREAHDRLREGTLPANHPSYTTVPTTALVPATLRRA